MKYFLFIDHPKGNLDTISEETEERIRSYFNRIDTIKTKVNIKGKEYQGIIDYGVFANLTNFDCFHCVEHCCGDAPEIFNKKIRKFILENSEKYNTLTKTFDILEELGHSSEEIDDMVLNEKVLVAEEYLENEIDLCPCAYTPKNGQTLCSLHSICLDKGLGAKEIIENKPFICSIWPLEMILEEDKNILYITLPDDFTNNFTLENYYTKSCINIDFAMSPVFRRENPDGFLEEDFIPFIFSYGETLKNILGNEVYSLIKEKLIEEELITEESSQQKEQLFKILV